MINAVMHILSWGLVIILVWGRLDQAPAPQKGHFKGLAELGEGVFLVAGSGVNKFGLVKFDGTALGYRAIKIDDWDGFLAGRLVGLCAIKGYDGEVLAAIAKPEGQTSLVHIQLRNWSKTPKSAVLGQVLLPDAPVLSAFSCGDATESSMPLTIYSQGQRMAADYSFKDYTLSNLRFSPSELDISGAYENRAGRWFTVTDPKAEASVIWLAPANGDAYPAFRLDGFNVTGLAAGSEGYDISVVTSEPNLGSVWRPLRLPLSQKVL